MRTQVFTTTFLAVLAIWLAVFGVGALVYDRVNKKKMLDNSKDGDWLFAGFHEKVFSLFYKDSKAASLCGINRETHARYAKILHKKPEFEKMVAMRVEGIMILMACLTIAWLMLGNIPFTIAFAFIGGISFYILYMFPFKKLQGDAEERLFHVEDDLPRYLSLLEKAMDLPVDKAMLVTASKFKSPLSEDIIDSINKVSLGADGWQTTLVDLAKTYDIKVFSDLMLEVINSYEQGVNIRPLINRKAYEVEQNRLYAVEAHDAKVKTLIYLPIIGLKILPLMAMICLPMLSEFI